jgi:hypothetical protein
MANAIFSAMSSMGLVGTNNFNICMAVSTGICNVIPSLVLFGLSPGVGVGVGTAKAVSFNPAAFYSMLVANMASLGLMGVAVNNLANALAQGICTTMSSALSVPVAAVAGAAGPAPGATVFPAQFV